MIPAARNPARKRSVSRRPPTLETIRKRKRKLEDIESSTKPIQPINLTDMKGFSTPVTRRDPSLRPETPNISLIGKEGVWPEGEEEGDSLEREMSLALELDEGQDAPTPSLASVTAAGAFGMAGEEEEVGAAASTTPTTTATAGALGAGDGLPGVTAAAGASLSFIVGKDKRESLTSRP